MNVCEALLDILHDYGVKYIFGIPGDSINELLEAIRKQDKIKFIHVMHEEAGSFAASAQAKLSGGLGVCCGTSGPGAIHLLNGLYDAKMDHAPVLAITGQVPSAMMGTAYQQEVNLEALFHDVAEYNQTIHTPEQMPEVAILACQTALSKSRVCHISIPIDISSQKVKGYKKKKQIIFNNSTVMPCADDLQKAADLINASEKPCILAGIGVRHAVPELLQVAEKINAPIIKALRGKDILPDEHPYTTGGIGLLGTEPSVKAMEECDLLLIAGSDFPYVEFYPKDKVKTIQIDKEANQIGRRHPVDVGLTGDSRLSLHELLPLIKQKTGKIFLERSRERKESWLKKLEKDEFSDHKPIRPQALARALSDLADDDAIICCDTGAVTVWGARHFRIKGNQKFTLSGGLATMAFGMSAAIGAKLLHPEKQVIALCGDGGFAMLMCDFATAVRYKLNIKVFVFNNSKLGFIQMEEEAKAGNPEFETELHNPDYAKFADACGGKGFTVKEPSELRTVVAKALATNKPCIINVFVNPEELTMPPEINATQAFNYVKAKVAEYMS